MPISCLGMAATAGGFGFGSLIWLATMASAWLVSGSSGNGSLFGLAKLNAEVRSPQTARRQGLIFGSMTPKRCSRKRITEVWSNTWELTQPPLLHGEITYIGTRGPRP